MNRIKILIYLNKFLKNNFFEFLKKKKRCEIGLESKRMFQVGSDGEWGIWFTPLVLLG